MGDDIVPGKDCFSSVFMVVGGEMHERDDNGKEGSQPMQKPGCCVIHVDDEATKCNGIGMEKKTESDAQVFHRQRLTDICKSNLTDS